MLEDEKRTEPESICSGSGFPLTNCDCFECTPHFFQLNQMFVECRSIEELVARLERTLDYFTYLDDNSFEISGVSDECGGRLIPSFIEDRYWVKCEGCGYPVSLPLGTCPKGFCGECHEKETSHEGLEPTYYDDLFDYVMNMCDLREEDGKTVWNCKGDLSFTDDFCKTHGFDFEAIKARLNLTGGFCDCEVLLNSMSSIPRFDRLPKLLDSRDDIEGSDEED